MFGAIENDEAIGFPVGGSGQNINVSKGGNVVMIVILKIPWILQYKLISQIS